jgi:DNA-binding NtrC family response regulator
MKKILILDDEREIRDQLKDFLTSKDYAVVESSSIKGALETFTRERPDAAILDYELPDGNSLDLIPRLKEQDPGVPVIVVTGHGSIELAVQAMLLGAENFLTKPAKLAALAVILERALDNARNRRVKRAAENSLSRASLDPFTGASDAIVELAEDAKKVLDTNRPVLIQGETGTGKGVLAAWIHQNSTRAQEALVNLNCAGLPKDFLETELFGHEKGAFTGASNAKTGLLEVGHKGTVFLDEVGDFDLQIQPKLLKVLEEQTFRRLGSVRDIHVDIRLIAATHQDIGRMVQQKAFRSDLYYRISTLQLRIPPLRERPEDIPLLAKDIVERFGVEMGREHKLLPDALEALQTYSWPGNIRELRNVLERTILLSRQTALRCRDLKFDTVPVTDRPHDAASDASLPAQEKRHIESVLQAQKWRISKAAKILGLSRSTLYRKIKEYRLIPPE